MYCPRCGTENHDNNDICIKCDLILHPDRRTILAEPENGMEKLIPYKNPKALASYYVGLFSFIPVLGLFIGLTALILGLVGLREARKNPEIRGKIHAWIGIILGGLFGFGYLSLTLIAIYFSIFR